MKHINKKTGFNFAEIMVAVFVLTLAAFPLFRVSTTSRVDTTKAINYLRATELANEALDWASAAAFTKEATAENFETLSQSFSGALNDPSNTDLCVSVPAADPDNKHWNELMMSRPSYCTQYAGSFFYRKIEVKDVNEGLLNEYKIDGDYMPNDILKQVIVTVYWGEQVKPTNLNSFDPEEGRDRKVVLSRLFTNDRAFTY